MFDHHQPRLNIIFLIIITLLILLLMTLPTRPAVLRDHFAQQQHAQPIDTAPTR